MFDSDCKVYTSQKIFPFGWKKKDTEQQLRYGEKSKFNAKSNPDPKSDFGIYILFLNELSSYLREMCLM
jgi:hypothetical protein